MLQCPLGRAINAVIKSLPGCRFSKTYQSWHIPVDKKTYDLLKKQLPPGWQITEIKDTVPAVAPAQLVTGTVSANAVIAFKQTRFTPLNAAALHELRVQLKLKGYSPNTIRTYSNEFSALLGRLGNIYVNDLQPEYLKRYMLFCTTSLRLSENTLHSRLNALKFYWEQVLHKEKFFFEIPRPKKHLQLPGVFNQDEIAAIINSVSNKKHKAMLMLSYSAGLRVSEVVQLKTTAVDSRRMTIFISRAKGKKDRVVSLSPVMLVMLREYAREYKLEKGGYLFQGAASGLPYSIRSLQEVLLCAKKKAGILRPGGMHSLRHSFATHLVDRGTDVTMIQKLLGHNDIKTTMRYLHTSNKDLLKIVSPLDSLDLR